MLRRRMMMYSRLPSGYQEVEYLESPTFGNLISTNIYSTKTTEIYADFKFRKIIPQDAYIISSYNNAQFTSINCINDPSVYRLRVWKGDVKGEKFPNLYYNKPETRYKVKLTNDGCIVNGIKYTTTFNMSGFQPSNFNLFGNSVSTSCVCVIYEAIIWDNGQKIGHLIPCYRKADHEAGMYDIVNGVFYTNQGTGEFIVGANVY